MATPLDPTFLDAIKETEGFAPKAAWDFKQYTNGYGTRAEHPGEEIDRETADVRFNRAIQRAADHVDSVVPGAPPGVRAALTSLTFNAGPGWSNAGLGDLVRAGDWPAAAARFQEYNKAGGQPHPGLTDRRTREAAWMTGGGVQQPRGAQSPLQTSSPQRFGSLAAFPWSPAAGLFADRFAGQSQAAPSASFADRFAAAPSEAAPPTPQEQMNAYAQQQHDAQQLAQMMAPVELQPPPPLQAPQFQVRKFAQSPATAPGLRYYKR